MSECEGVLFGDGGVIWLQRGKTYWKVACIKKEVMCFYPLFSNGTNFTMRNCFSLVMPRDHGR